MKPKGPLTFRMSEPLSDRLEEASRRLKLKKYTLALLAIEAAVEAIEKNDYRLVVPIEFKVTHVPGPGSVRYPEHQEGQHSFTEDKPISDARKEEIADSLADALEQTKKDELKRRRRRRDRPPPTTES